MLTVLLYIASITKSNLININYLFNATLLFCVEIYFWHFKREHVFTIFKGMYEIINQRYSQTQRYVVGLSKDKEQKQLDAVNNNAQIRL